MKHLKLVFASLAYLGSMSANAQDVVNVTNYITNANFTDYGTPVSVGVCTYEKDKGTNGTQYSQLAPVEAWNIPENGDARAGGIFTPGSGAWLGGPGYTVPATDSNGDTNVNVLGTVGVWTGKAQYTSQAFDIWTPGVYTMVVAVYNSVGGTTDFDKSLIGVIESNGTEHLAPKRVYSVNQWTYEFVTFYVEDTFNGYISLGYKSTNFGSSNEQHLFFSGLELYRGEIMDQDAYVAEKEAVRNAKELEANKQRLEGSSYTNPSEDLLINGSFNTANQGWTLDNMKYQQNGERPTRYVEQWNQNPLSGSGSATQTIKNLPAGAYILKGTAHTNQAEEGGATLNVNGQSIPVTGAWTEYEIVYNLEQDGDVTVAFNWSGLNSNWIAIDEFTLVYGGPYDQYITDKETLGPKKEWQDALAAAQAALADEANENISGEELAALQEEVAKAEPTTAQGYTDATAALIAATTTFTNAKAAYDALANTNQMITEAGELPYADQAKKPEILTAVNATEAAANADANIINLRAYYESNAAAEGVEGAVDMTSIVSEANSDVNKGWTNGIGTNSGQGYTDAAGNVAPNYLDGGWASNAGANIDMTRVVEVPAGKYLLTVTARGSASLDEYTLSIADKTITLPHIGNVGGVFNNGWYDASVEFESDGTPLTLEIIARSTATQQWISLNRFRLVQLEEIEVPMADEADYTALMDAAAPYMGLELGFDEGEYAPYNNVDAILLGQEIASLDPVKVENKEYTKEYIQGLTARVRNIVVVPN